MSYTSECLKPLVDGCVKQRRLSTARNLPCNWESAMQLGSVPVVVWRVICRPSAAVPCRLQSLIPTLCPPLSKPLSCHAAYYNRDTTWSPDGPHTHRFGEIHPASPFFDTTKRVYNPVHSGLDSFEVLNGLVQS